jgi:hypothetical protein
MIRYRTRHPATLIPPFTASHPAHRAIHFRKRASKTELFPEAGNFNVCQEVGKSSILAYFGKPKLHIKLQPGKPKKENPQSYMECEESC